jgi:hypothetical protein
VSLYEQILEIARDYMGAAAEDYIQRRIRIVQRGEDPRTVTADRVSRLVAGVRMTAKVYMSARRADAFCEALARLSDDS